MVEMRHTQKYKNTDKDSDEYTIQEDRGYLAATGYI